MRNHFLYITTLFVVLFFVSSCEDVIDVDLGEGEDQLIVDAWINNQLEEQVINLSRTSPYFDASPAAPELGASVLISANGGMVYNFVDEDNNGSYIWQPTSGVGFGTIGRTYVLEIETADGKRYQATSTMNRTTPVDSIAVEFEEESLGEPEGFYAEFFGVDPVGPGDAYWIKTFKNDQFLNKPQEMNLAFDAGFTAGAMVDGVTFITPIREGVNRVPDSGDDAIDTDTLPPYMEGDLIRVEIHSLSFEAFEFLEQVRTQTTLGDAGIFAEPPTNVPSNIIPVDSNDPADRPVGFFTVSAVESLERRI